MRMECPSCKSTSISEVETINQDINYTKGTGKILSDFQCDQCEECFRVEYEIEIKEVKFR